MRGKRLLFLAMQLFFVCIVAVAQTPNVSGVVYSPEGDPIVGASVRVEGSKMGTVTDINGRFSLSLPKGNEKITVSYLGMTPKTVKAGQNLKITLDDDSKALNEVMVVAYGTVKKAAFTGSATEVDAEKLKTPSASLDKGLAGQVAGVQVVSQSGQPGSATSFRIRGSGSLSSSNQPLIVIDGVPTSNEEYSQVASDNDASSNILATINPNDIESVTILKDAAAAALYGSRAANGVVVITTKSGKTGKAKVSFDAKYTTSSLAGRYDVANAGESYKTLYNAYLAAGNSYETANSLTQGALTHNPYNVDNPYDASGNLVSGAKLVVDTDWQDEVFNPASTYDVNLSVSGGSQKTSYFFSTGYLNQEGISPSANYKRYSGSMNIKSDATDWLTLGLNSKFSYSIQETEVAGSAGASPLYNAVSFNSAVPVYIVDSNGSPVLDANGNKQYNFTNPVSRDFNPIAIPSMDKHESKMMRFIGSAFLEAKLLKGLTFKTVFSPDIVYSNELRYWNQDHGNGPAYNGRLDRYHTTDIMYTFTNTLNYTTEFEGGHHLNLLAGMEYWQSTYEYLYAGGTGVGDSKELAQATALLSPNSYTTKETMISYFGRAEYSYLERYNLAASLRTDGSSIFGDDNKWGTFWSVSGAWRINNEAFMKDYSWIDNLKLRVSYGTSGNKSGIANYLYNRYLSQGIYGIDAGYKYGSDKGAVLVQLENKALAWEAQKMFNVGVDFSFWNRFYGSLDYFHKVSDGLLYKYPLAEQNGLLNVTMNAAKVANHGWELMLGYNILKDSPVKWNIELNASIIRDEIKDLYGDDDVRQTTYAKIWSVGGSQYEFYMPTWAGVDSATGDPLWYTVAEDGTRTTTNSYSKATYERQGRSTPDVYGGIHNTLSYKNFDLNVQINYTIGGKVYDGIYANMMSEGNDMSANIHKDELKAWTTPGQVTNVPKFTVNNTSLSNSLSTRFLYNATNVRLANVTLSYRLPSNLGILSKVITGGKIYVSGDNLATWFSDDWKGYNDIDIYGVQGYSSYPSIPTPRSFTVGANLTF